MTGRNTFTPKQLGWITTVTIVLAWLGPFSMDAYSPSFPALAADFRVDDRLVQLTLTAVMVGMCVGQLIFGPLSDRWGRRRPLIVALSLYVLVSIGCAAAGSIWWLVAGRVGQGLTAAAAVSLSRAIGRDIHSGVRLAKFYSWLGATTAVAPIVGPITGATLMRLGSWRLIFLMIALLGAVGLILVIWRLPETRWAREPTGRRMADTEPAAPLSREQWRRLLIVCGLSALVSGALMSYLAGSPFLLQDGYGLSSQQYSAVFAVNAVGLVSFSALNTRLVSRFSSAQILFSAVPCVALVGTGLCVVTACGGGLWPVLALFAALVSCQGLIAPNVIAIGMAVSRERAGFVSGVLGVSQFVVGGATAPLLGGGEGTGIPILCLTIAGYSVLASILLYLGRSYLVTGAINGTYSPARLDEMPSEEFVIEVRSNR